MEQRHENQRGAERSKQGIDQNAYQEAKHTGFEAIKITDRVYWVGVIDWELRDFHGYQTPRGSTYNAYLILGKEPVLIDTVKAPFLNQMMARIASVIDPTEIAYIVSNHSEMDHTGSLPRTIELLQPKKVFASIQGVKAIEAHFHLGLDVEVAQNGGVLELGDIRLKTLETRMLHWPDSMFSYLEGDGVLFSNDAFGMHLASAARFDDEIDEALLYEEAAKYYANILMPFSKLVKNLLDKLPSFDLDIKVLAPDHGPVWRSDWQRIVNWYANWSAGRPTKKAVVLYDTMWQSTRKLALALAEGLAAGGAEPHVLPLSGVHRSDVATEMLDAGALAVGAPTMNNNLFPRMADYLTYLKGLKPQNLVAVAFGSYGWSGEAVKQIESYLEAMKAEILEEGLKVQYVPDAEALNQARELGRRLAARLLEKIKEETR